MVGSESHRACFPDEFGSITTLKRCRSELLGVSRADYHRWLACGNQTVVDRDARWLDPSDLLNGIFYIKFLSQKPRGHAS